MYRKAKDVVNDQIRSFKQSNLKMNQTVERYYAFCRLIIVISFHIENVKQKNSK